LAALAAGFALIGGAVADENGRLIAPVVVGLESSEIAGFAEYPEPVRDLLEKALALTRRNLGYRFGSSDPARGGLDCSGAIFYLLREVGRRDVPRSSEEIYQWVLKKGTFQPVNARTLDSRSFDALRPGDLLFWTGTYAAGGRKVVTHVMIYLGRAKSDGLPLMVGSSDGRTYRGKKCFGVSVFDFRLPKEESRSRFIGHAGVPGLAPG
jgi:hypothetical protein